MHRFFSFLLIFIYIFTHSILSNAAKGGGSKPKPLALETQLGFTNISFSGIRGSDFSSFNHYVLDFSLQYFRQKGWQWFGVGTSLIPGLAFKNVRWSDGNYGNYTVSFQNSYLFFGGAHGKFRWALLGGYETITWTGSPTSNPSKPNYFNNGFFVGWDWYQKGQWSFPLYFRYWRKPRRQITFGQFPSEPIYAQAGSEFDITIGAHIGF